MDSGAMSDLRATVAGRLSGRDIFICLMVSGVVVASVASEIVGNRHGI
jgi:hypothetical protein